MGHTRRIRSRVRGAASREGRDARPAHRSNRGGAAWRTHRLAWSAQHGEIPKENYVCHRCDNPDCIAIEHLFLGTPGENYANMRDKGRSRYNAKLSREEVAAIRRRIGAGETAVAGARDYQVNYDQIIAINHGHAWRDLSG